jgi:hypothetical protein
MSVSWKKIALIGALSALGVGAWLWAFKEKRSIQTAREQIVTNRRKSQELASMESRLRDQLSLRTGSDESDPSAARKEAISSVNQKRPDHSASALATLIASHPDLRALYVRYYRATASQQLRWLIGRTDLSGNQASALLDNLANAEATRLAEGLGPSDPKSRLTDENLQSQSDQLLAPTDYAPYQEYERALPFEGLVSGPRLFLADSAQLTGDQAAALTQILAEANPNYAAGGVAEKVYQTDWHQVLERASTILSPVQLTVFNDEVVRPNEANFLAQTYYSQETGDTPPLDR